MRTKSILHALVLPLFLFSNPIPTYAQDAQDAQEILMLESGQIVDEYENVDEQDMKISYEISKKIDSINWDKQSSDFKKIIEVKDDILTHYKNKKNEQNKDYQINSALNQLDMWVYKTDSRTIKALPDSEKEFMIQALKSIEKDFNTPSIGLYKLTGDKDDIFDKEAYKKQREQQQEAIMRNIANQQVGVNDMQDTTSKKILDSKEERPLYMLIISIILFGISSALIIYNIFVKRKGKIAAVKHLPKFEDNKNKKDNA